MIHASAPGKVILFGEHAVVYGRPALAVPVTQVHADVEIGESPDSRTWIGAPDIGLYAALDSLDPSTHPLATVIIGTFNALGIISPPPLKISVHSTIPVASGLGSGAAVSVAMIRALSAAIGHSLSDEEVNALAYESEKLHHGTPSGIDNTVITYAKPVYFLKGQPVQTFDVARPFTIVIGDTGISAPTREAVGDVKKLWQADTVHWEKVFDQVGEIAHKAKTSIENGTLEVIGGLMNENHLLLQEMTVSSPELDKLVLAALKAGADGAKLSGGGRGGNIIAKVKPEKANRVANALLAAGAKQALITVIRP
jgi:mevalonate kinase